MTQFDPAPTHPAALNPSAIGSTPIATTPAGETPVPVAHGQKLYDPATVGIAAFLGSPLAGAAVIALNYRRMGLGAKARTALSAGVAASALMILFGLIVPSSTLTFGLGIGAIIVTRNVARSLQGSALAAHVAAGGALGSRWMGFFIGLAGLVVLLCAIVLVVASTTGPKGTRLAIGKNDEIFYSGTATEADAKALGAALQKDGFLQDRGVPCRWPRGPAAQCCRSLSVKACGTSRIRSPRLQRW